MHAPIIIIGAGAAGVGMGITLRKMGMPFLILEQGRIGESFFRWPPGTRLLSPSFTGNSFGAPDLNAVCPDTSPALMLDSEHPTGAQYGFYLQQLSEFYQLPVDTGTKVTSLTREEDQFSLTTDQQDYTADVIIWAGGEFQFPRTQAFPGSALAVHNTLVEDWNALDGEVFPIVGGYESGFDTAIQLAKAGKKSVIFDSEDHVSARNSDPSVCLSPFTRDRLLEYQDFIRVEPHTRIQEITEESGTYTLTSEGGQTYEFTAQPLLATGFETSLKQVKHFFDWEDGVPQLTDEDESTKVDNFFLIGPQVKHDQTIFCFIYKFRQRFTVVADAISQRFALADPEVITAVIQDYADKNFHLDDLSCCGAECAC